MSIDFEAIFKAIAKRAGTLDSENVHEVPRRIPASILEALRKIDVDGPSGLVADALDELGGVRGCIPASVLHPTLPGSVIVGTALTVRSIPSRYDPSVLASSKISRFAPLQVHQYAKPGDILVIQSAGSGSSGGGDSALIGKHYGELGAVIDGAVREVGQSRRAGYPIWVREITPMSGKWRNDAVEINGVVSIAGIQVAPGDLVVADDSGVCFVPAELAEKVLAWCTEHLTPSPARIAFTELRERADPEWHKRVSGQG